jgi:hypothetical protein
MDANLFQRMRQHIIGNEGVSPTPYRDSAGLLTAGYGFKVDSADAFAKLPFQVKDGQSGTMRPATEAEKRAEFDRIRSLPQKQLEGEADKGKAFVLTEPDMDSKLASEIAAREARIKTEVGAANWDLLSDGQKTAVLDVHYANGSLTKFPDLKQAIKDGNAEEIGRNVDFHGTNPDGSWQYNEGRLIRNRAAAQDISEDDARRSVEEDMKSGKLGRKNKTSDASDGTDEAPPKLTSTSIGELSTTSIAALDIPPATSVKGAPLETATPQDSNVGGLANEAQETAKALEASEQTANTDSRIASMREMAAQPIDHPGKSALLKPVDKWTESEMKDVLNAAQGDFTGWQSGDPLKAHMYERVQDWHSHVYGDGEQQYDGGKPVEPKPVREVSDKPVPHLTKEGEDLWKASTRMGDKLGTIAETDGYSPSVKAMQRGLNMLNESAGQPERSETWGPYTKQEPLKMDGEYGPKTDFALKDTLACHGETKADDALALGRFGNFADQVKQSGKADGLEKAAKDIFGPLYGGSDAPNGVLQETLNKVGGESVDGWQDLKVDDWIGPKTTDAFAGVMENVDPEDFTRSFGQGLGLL